jgi:PAS domain S-box-containing protein
VLQLNKARPAFPPDAESVPENATGGFLVYNSEFQFVYLNRDGDWLLGKPKTDLLGKTQWDLFPETIGTEIERQYRRATTDRVATIFEYLYPSLETFEIRVSPSTSGGLLVGLRDITARRQTEIQREGLLLGIQAERQILSEIIEKAPVAISVMRAPDFTYELDIHGTGAQNLVSALRKGCRDVSATAFGPNFSIRRRTSSLVRPEGVID